jgi:hypothetical protein
MMTGAGGAMLSLYKLEQAVTELPIEELPNLIGDLARLQAKANARLYGQLVGAAPSSKKDEVLTVAQVAKMLNRSPDHVYRSCQRKDGIPHGRDDGGRLWFKHSKVEEWRDKKCGGDEHADLPTT